MDVPTARLGLAGEISIDTSRRATGLSSRQPLRTSRLNSSVAPVNFIATDKLRDERAKKLPNILRLPLGAVVGLIPTVGKSKETMTNRFAMLSTSSRFPA